MYGRLPKRSDPVSGYLSARLLEDEAVLGSFTPQLPAEQRLRQAEQPPAAGGEAHLKATHPLQDSMGTSDYVVPSSKPRTRERINVRDCAKWTEVYQPRKTNRVEANQMIKEYVPPDAKRRDDVRWRTRVMMLS
eukprot:749743-Hanusia_phi.AAC.1